MGIGNSNDSSDNEQIDIDNEEFENLSQEEKDVVLQGANYQEELTDLAEEYLSKTELTAVEIARLTDDVSREIVFSAGMNEALDIEKED
jgi:hypothetical protein